MAVFTPVGSRPTIEWGKYLIDLPEMVVDI